MALNNGGLEDAGREYYDKQFGARIGDIRKPGAAPRPTASGGNGKKAGGAIGGVVVAVFVLIKIFAACGGDSELPQHLHAQLQLHAAAAAGLHTAAAAGLQPSAGAAARAAARPRAGWERSRIQAGRPP